MSRLTMKEVDKRIEEMRLKRQGGKGGKDILNKLLGQRIRR